MHKAQGAGWESWLSCAARQELREVCAEPQMAPEGAEVSPGALLRRPQTLPRLAQFPVGLFHRKGGIRIEDGVAGQGRFYSTRDTCSQFLLFHRVSGRWGGPPESSETKDMAQPLQRLPRARPWQDAPVYKTGLPSGSLQLGNPEEGGGCPHAPPRRTGHPDRTAPRCSVPTGALHPLFPAFPFASCLHEDRARPRRRRHRRQPQFLQIPAHHQLLLQDGKPGPQRVPFRLQPVPAPTLAHRPPPSRLGPLLCSLHRSCEQHHSGAAAQTLLMFI